MTKDGGRDCRVGHIVPVVGHWDSMAQADQKGGWTQTPRYKHCDQAGESELALSDEGEMRSYPSLGNHEFGYFPEAVALARWRVNPAMEGRAAISLRVYGWWGALKMRSVESSSTVSPSCRIAMR